jgi:predicted glycoside hydrolase/deacetylase ChbG (UPF0249 family)
MKQLIVNADDFGLCDGVNRGIAESMLEGIVCSTSVMPCDPNSLHKASRWLGKLRNRIGVHLQLTGGIPCAEPESVRSLLSVDNRLPHSIRDMRAPNTGEILVEWRCQMERVLKYGFVPTHIDTHHYVHGLPVAFEAYCEIARLYNLPARTRGMAMTSRLRSAGVRCADLCETKWYKKHLDVSGLARLIDAGFKLLGGQGTLELMCHPGYNDGELRQNSSYTEQREIEVEVLCDSNLAGHLEKQAIVLVDRATDKKAEWC